VDAPAGRRSLRTPQVLLESSSRLPDGGLLLLLLLLLLLVVVVALAAVLGLWGAPVGRIPVADRGSPGGSAIVGSSGVMPMPPATNEYRFTITRCREP
jgi:predicted permease